LNYNSLQIPCVYACVGCNGRGCKKCDYMGVFFTPVSVNQMYSGGHKTRRRFLTKKGESWKQHISDTVLWSTLGGKVLNLPKPARFELWLKWVFPDNRKRDPDNYIKAVKDSLSGIVYADDNQVFKEHNEKEIIKGKWSLEISWEVMK